MSDPTGIFFCLTMTRKTGTGVSAAGVDSLANSYADCYFQNGFTQAGCTHSFTIKINVMKLLLAALSLFFFQRPADPLLVIDKDLKKPLAYTTTFTTQQYLQRMFPVYAQDVPALVEATDKAVKWIEKEQACNGSTKFNAEHTSIFVDISCDKLKTVTVTLITQVDESNTSYSFSLIRNEEDLRKAQRRMLDFATYIEP